MANTIKIKIITVFRAFFIILVVPALHEINSSHAL